MGSLLCRANSDHLDYGIFEYRYGEDNKETKIVHNDRIESRNQSIRPSLVDCETKLKKSQKRFRDVTMTIDPVRLICGERQIPCTFERPDAFLKREANLRNKIYRIVDKNNARPSNITVGDQVLQYFGVFLCYLASNPDIIDQIILTQQNSYGICAVHMNIDKKRFVIYIDDYILCYDNKPLFSGPIKYTDMWPCLLEKAWFKVKSCLKTKIQKINPIQVFETFLSYPIKRFQLTESYESNQQLVRKQLIQPCLKDSNFGCVVSSKMKPQHKIGISGRKHFYLLKIIVFEQRIYFYLRNPCGQFDFRGATKEIPGNLQQAIFKETGEGIVPGNFLLTEEEFDQQIQSFFIVMYSPASPNISEEDLGFASSDRQEIYIRFQLKKAGAVGMRLQQINNSGDYSPLTYQLVDLQRNSVVSGYLNEEGCFGVEEANLMSGSYQVLMPSNYMLRIKKKRTAESLNAGKGSQANESHHRDRLIVSSNEDIKFQFSATGQFKSEFERTIKQIAKKQLAEDKKALRDEIEQIVIWLGDLVVVYANKLNTGRDSVNLQVHFPDLKNLECLTHSIAKGYTSLPPFPQDILILFQKINLTEETLLGKYSLTPY